MPSEPRWDAEVDGLPLLPVRAPRPIAWKDEGDVILLALPGSGRELRLKAFHARILEAVNEGTTVVEIVASLRRALPDADARTLAQVARFFVHQLQREGLAEVTLPPVPEVFAGRWARRRELGRGGEGIAWLCEDQRDGGRAVVKHAWDLLQPFAVAEAALRREAACLGSLGHAGFARVFATFELEGRFHLARAFVDGPDLVARVEARGPPPGEVRAALLRQLAEALAHAHEGGWLLLDVKPNNLMLAGDQLTFTDAGLAVPHRNGEATEQPSLGGAFYTAPEVLARRGAGVRSDVWGWGRVGLFLALGQHVQPRDDATLGERLRGAGIGEKEARLLLDSAAADPAARPSDMGDVLRRLADL